MLLNVWDSWWAAMSRLQARENRNQFVIAQAADSGWIMDRRSILDNWERLAMPPERTRTAQELKAQMQRFRNWMVSAWGAVGGLVKKG